MTFKNSTNTPGWTYRNRPEFRALLADVGAKLRELRLDKGLSQREVTRLNGATNGMVSNLEHGKTMGVTLYSLFRLADGYGYDVKISFERRARAVRRADGDG